jgi:hypothetical protein
MPILTTQPIPSLLIPSPGVAVPLRTLQGTQQRHPLWLAALRQRFSRHAPQRIPVSDASLARRAGELVQHEVAFAAFCQGVTVEVDQGIITLYGSVDTARRKERLAELLRTMPGVQQVANRLLAEDELDARLQQRLQALVTAGTLDRLPKFLVEQQMVELYGEVATSEQRNLVEREALAVPGVRVVINHLSVPQQSGTRVHTTNR